jgi:DNA-binding SARP family transcriptional activator
MLVAGVRVLRSSFYRLRTNATGMHHDITLRGVRKPVQMVRQRRAAEVHWCASEPLQNTVSGAQPYWRSKGGRRIEGLDCVRALVGAQQQSVRGRGTGIVQQHGRSGSASPSLPTTTGVTTLVHLFCESVASILPTPAPHLCRVRSSPRYSSTRAPLPGADDVVVDRRDDRFHHARGAWRRVCAKPARNLAVGLKTDVDRIRQPPVVLRLWGEFRLVDAAGVSIEVGSRKARALLVLLANAPNATESRDRLAAMLWGDRSDAQARANLRQLLYELKRLACVDVPILASDRRSVWLESTCESETAAQGRLPAAELAGRLPPRSVVFLADLDGVSEEFDEWLSTERGVAESNLRNLVQTRVDAALTLGNARDARALADAWAARDGIDETIARAGLRADAALGDTAGLARRLKRLQAALAVEIGARPSPATLALARELTQSGAAQASSCPAGAVRDCDPQPALATPTRRGPQRWRIALPCALALALAGAAALQGLPRSARSVASTEAHRLTASARALTHGRTGAGYAQAVEFARRAIASDPDFAPAWAELALATWMPAAWFEGEEAAKAGRLKAKALGYVDHALLLQPGLGRALAVRGLIDSTAPPSSWLEPAVIAAPEDAEAWLWLGNRLSEVGKPRAALAAYRRAVELDPLWNRSANAFAGYSAELGEYDSAEAALDRFASVSSNRYEAETLRANIAIMRGDLAAAAGHVSQALMLAPDDPSIPLCNLVRIARATGDLDAIRRIVSTHRIVWGWATPFFDPAGAVGRARGAPATWWDSFGKADEARALLRAGRTDLLLALYAKRHRPATDFDHGSTVHGTALAAQLVTALRSAHRDGEADALLASARRDLARLAAVQYPHFSFDLDSALVAALESRDHDAVSALERAFDKGWRGQSSDWAVDPADEPAFVRLRGRGDFERVRARLRGELDRIRPEIAAIFARTPAPAVRIAAIDDSP